ncbi:hypothetical protein A9K65_002495 [Mesorhizobium sp. WSM1497]|nr:hypothetical protein A9K65_002495 [Mesorhizobium sp. WSM1497]
MPRLLSVAAVRNSAPLHHSAKVTEWIPGSPRRSFAPAPPRDDEVWVLRPSRIVSASGHVTSASASTI